MPRRHAAIDMPPEPSGSGRPLAMSVLPVETDRSAPGGLANALLRELPDGVVLLDRAAVSGRSRSTSPRVGLMLHQPDCHRELLNSLGVPALGRIPFTALAAGFAVLVVPKTGDRTLCVGGLPDAVESLEPAADRDAAREPRDGCGEALFRCIARNFPGGWIYAFDPAFTSLLGVGSVLALLGVSRSRIDGAVTLRWFAPAPAARRCLLTGGPPQPVPRPARLSILAQPDGTVVTQVEL
jgi:hypothetical protein